MTKPKELYIGYVYKQGSYDNHFYRRFVTEIHTSARSKAEAKRIVKWRTGLPEGRFATQCDDYYEYIFQIFKGGGEPPQKLETIK